MIRIASALSPELMEQRYFQGLVGAEAAGFPKRELRTEVHRLHGAGADLLASTEVVDDERRVLAKRPREALDVGDPRAQRTGTPAAEEPLGSLGARVAPEALQALLQQVGAHRPQVGAEHIAEPASLRAREVGLGIRCTSTVLAC